MRERNWNGDFVGIILFDRISYFANSFQIKLTLA